MYYFVHHLSDYYISFNELESKLIFEIDRKQKSADFDSSHLDEINVFIKVSAIKI